MSLSSIVLRVACVLMQSAQLLAIGLRNRKRAPGDVAEEFDPLAIALANAARARDSIAPIQRSNASMRAMRIQKSVTVNFGKQSRSRKQHILQAIDYNSHQAIRCDDYMPLPGHTERYKPNGSGSWRRHTPEQMQRVAFHYIDSSASQTAIINQCSHKHVLSMRSAVAELLCEGMRARFLECINSGRFTTLGLNIAFDETEFDLQPIGSVVVTCPVFGSAGIVHMSDGINEIEIEELVFPPLALQDKTADTMWTALNDNLPMSVFDIAAKCTFFVWIGSHDSVPTNHRISNHIDTESPINVFPHRHPCSTHKFSLCLSPMLILCDFLNPMFAAVKHLHVSRNYERKLKMLRKFLEERLVWSAGDTSLINPADTQHLQDLFELTLYANDLTHTDIAFLDAASISYLMEKDKAYLPLRFAFVLRWL